VYQGYRICTVNKWTTSDDNLGIARESASLSSEYGRVFSPIAWLPGIEIPEDQQNHGCVWLDYKLWFDEDNLWQILKDVCFLDLEIEKDLYAL
jgi:hypothetical protein